MCFVFENETVIHLWFHALPLVDSVSPFTTNVEQLKHPVVYFFSDWQRCQAVKSKYFT